MEAIEIKLDPATLPEDNQEVSFQTTSDVENETWSRGVFSKGG